VEGEDGVTSWRRRYDRDPGLGDRVFRLLERVFPGVSAARFGAARFGASWESASIPFVREDRDQVVAHVGLLELPLVVEGQPLRVGGVHGVATDPQRRREGLFRSLLAELLDYSAERYETLVLTTAHPEYFTPFGFRPIPESVFQCRVRRPAGPPGFRRLDLGHPTDRAIVDRLLAGRCPVSAVLGTGPERAVWAFYEAESVLRYSEALDCVVVAERDGARLRLFDVVGERIPPVAELLEQLDEPVDDVVAYFAPDRLGGRFTVQRHDLTGGPTSLEPGVVNPQLMARGPFPLENPAMLPRPARC
jgi:predicted N-acetyltransferase YhbS